MKLGILILFLLAAFPPAVLAEAQLLDRVVAVVDNEVITQSELDIMLRPIYEELRQRYQGQELFKNLAEIRLKLLNQLIEDRLVYQEAEERGIQANENEVNRRFSEFSSQFETSEELEEMLKYQGMTRKSIKERLRRQVMIQTLHDMEIRSRIVVSPLEVQKYYEEHLEEFTEKEQIRIRSVTLKKSHYAREKGLKDEEAWDLTQSLKSKILEGADFAKISSRYSQDINAEEGGLGKWVDQGQMIPAIDQVIFSLKVGEMSDVIETSMGYHLFRVEEKKSGRKLSLDEARDMIHSKIFKEKSNKKFESWMEDLKNKSYISIR